MAWLNEMLQQGQPATPFGPQLRAIIDEEAWTRAAANLASGYATLLAMWGEADTVHLAIQEGRTIGILTLACPNQQYPSLATVHPPALRLERTIRDLCGLQAVGSPDLRRWIDHGRWGVHYPLGRNEKAAPVGEVYPFLLADGPPMHQIAVGPVHAGIIEPGHFRFTANGETIVRLEERLGYVHKGVDQLMTGAPLERAAKLAGRVSGDSTVAYAIAFAQAAEMTLALAPPERAIGLRALMAELERIANHFGDIGAVCNDASFSLIHAHCGILREHVLRVADACFGHRLMMDCVVPGGVAADLSDQGTLSIRTLIRTIRRRFPELIELYDNTASLQDRTVATGILKPELAATYGAGGFVGRASGRSFDARKTPGYAPYTHLQFHVPVRHDGDVNARVWIRIDEVRQSISLIEQILENLPQGAIQTLHFNNSRTSTSREGLALVEGFRGDIFVWIRLGADGTIARCHLRDPSAFQWPLLEAVIEGNIVADFPLCNKSFNCSYSGHDL